MFPPSAAVTPIQTVTQAAGTLASTGTFVVALAANISRVGGIIQNHGTNNMEIFAGGTTAATAAGVNAGLVVLANNGTRDLTFGMPNGVYIGDVCIAGTSGDIFTKIENTVTVV